MCGIPNLPRSPVFGLFAICGYRFSPQNRRHLRCSPVTLRPGQGLRAAAAGLPPARAGGADPAPLGGHAPRRRVPDHRQGPAVRPAADDDQRRPETLPTRNCASPVVSRRSRTGPCAAPWTTVTSVSWTTTRPTTPSSWSAPSSSAHEAPPDTAPPPTRRTAGQLQ